MLLIGPTGVIIGDYLNIRLANRSLVGRVCLSVQPLGKQAVTVTGFSSSFPSVVWCIYFCGQTFAWPALASWQVFVTCQVSVLLLKFLHFSSLYRLPPLIPFFEFTTDFSSLVLFFPSLLLDLKHTHTPIAHSSAFHLHSLCRSRTGHCDC